MESPGTRFELRVRTLLSKAAIATFRVPVRPTAVPGRTVYRFRVPADRDLSELLHLLTQRHVQVLGIRRCAAPTVEPSTTDDASGDETGFVVPPPRPCLSVAPDPVHPRVGPASGQPGSCGADDAEPPSAPDAADAHQRTSHARLRGAGAGRNRGRT